MMSNAKEKKFVEDAALDEIPVGVSVNHEVLPPDVALALAEQHFMDEARDAKGAVGHEWLSMVPAMGTALYGVVDAVQTMSPKTLVDYWGSGVALSFSVPILRSLMSAQASAEEDLRRVRRIKEHFNKHGDPRILHAAGLRLEGYDPEDLKGLASKVDENSYQSNYCVDGEISNDNFERAKTRIQTNKPESQNICVKACSFFAHVGHDVHALFKDPKGFAVDFKNGWKSTGLQMVMLKNDIADSFKERAVNKEKAAQPEISNDNAPVLSEAEQQHQIGVEREKSRLQHEWQKSVDKMRGITTSLALETGFLGVESVNGVKYCVESVVELSPAKFGLGVAHLFSAVMGMRPAQILAQQNTYLMNNITSERGQYGAPDDLKNPPAP